MIEAKRRLAMWSVDNNVITTTQGWVPVEGNVGGWAPVADRPDVIVETAYPMFKLAPDPTKPDHDARFGTILFGLVPTTLADVDSAGRPRLDDVNVYEIRCFVRRRSDDHCPGELVWSEPTEAFRVASLFDPVGCGYRAVNVRLPDLNDLEATLARPNVRMSSPPNSHLMFATDPVPPEDGTVGAAEEICFFAIPLITIVAFFLLNLFLPIVIFVFQLWFLLKLKFCIPPSIELGAGADRGAVGDSRRVPGDGGHRHRHRMPESTRRSCATACGAASTPSKRVSATRLTATLTNNAIIQALIAQGAGNGRQSLTGRSRRSRRRCGATRWCTREHDEQLARRAGDRIERRVAGIGPSRAGLAVPRRRDLDLRHLRYERRRRRCASDPADPRAPSRASG